MPVPRDADRPLPRWSARLMPLSLLVLAIAASTSARAAELRFSEKERSHWAYRAIARSEIPAVKQAAAVRTPVDAFVLRRLEQAGLSLSPPATRRVLIRRLKFDLLGLPPTPGEIEQFVADESPGAYERLVERFLASPRYGETWGRHWLDLVRFAETAGFNADPVRPLAYKYRDYVIRAFNADKPYNRFIAEQIAGDELYPESVDAWIATGYLRMWPDESNASNVLRARQNALNDLTANVGSVFLASSLGCAQCHDHKFDPLLQDDFYRLQAFLVGAVWTDQVAVGTAEQLAEYNRKLSEWLAETAPIRGELHQIEQSAEIKVSHVKRLKFPDVVLEAIDTAVVKRTAYQRQLAFWSERQIVVSQKQLLAKMSAKDQKRRKELQARLKELEKSKPRPPATAAVMACRELPNDVPRTDLLAGGSYNAPMWEVEPAVLTVVEENRPYELAVSPPRRGTSGRRTALVRWLTADDNPLTARVMANRIWQGHFGRGLVENANDFGTRTAPPTHPQLLDWLAREFVSRGWSVKALHRLIVNSAVYRQSNFQRVRGTEESRATALGGSAVADRSKAVQADAGNRLYWHFPRKRLPAEAIRDALLAVSGHQSDVMYGPGVRPELPPNYSSRARWKVSKSEADRHRRSIYIFAKRNLPYPLLKVFDFPDMHESCARRAQTTVAPQALLLLNSELVTGYAKGMAGRLLAGESTGDSAALVRAAYESALGRLPTDAEQAEAVSFLLSQQELVDAKTDEAAFAAAYGDFCHALLNSNEFIYVE